MSAFNNNSNNKITMYTKGKKHILKTLSKYQNWSQIWQEGWNYQTKNFLKTIIKMLQILVEKVDNMQEQMDNISREM